MSANVSGSIPVPSVEDIMTWIPKPKMKPFFRPSPNKKSKLSLGARCKIKVPEDKKDTHGPFDGATVKIVSKKDFLARHTIKNIEPTKVVCKILSAPNAGKGVKVVGLEYPIRRAWLIEDGHKCACDLRVIMTSGCKCGGY